MKFKVGDRVRAIGTVDHLDLTGKTGTVIGINTGCYEIAVKFDEKFSGGHDCNKRGEYGYCRYGYYSEFELISKNKIVITTDGAETLARLYEGDKVIKTATAKCNPEDTFDFKIGAKLAYDRLMGEERVEEKVEEPKETHKYQNGDYARIIAIHCGHEFPIASIVRLKITGDHYHATDSKGDNWAVTDSELAPVEWKVVNRAAKKGDYVRVTTDYFSFNKKGDILKVDHPFGYGGIRVLGKDHPRPTSGDDDYLWSYTKDQYEVIEPVETSKTPKTPKTPKTLETEKYKFKVGDRVRYFSRYDSKRNGKVGTIICIKADECHYGVEFDQPGIGCHNCDKFKLVAGRIGTSGNCYWCPTDYLDLYTETKNYKFKVGDKVIGNEKASKRYPITNTGWRGIVTKVDENSFTAKGKGIFGDVEFDLEYEYFDLDDGKESPKKESPKSKYKPGDKVEVIACDSCHDYRIGQIVTLKNIDDSIFECSQGIAWRVENGICYIRECDFKPYTEPTEYYNGKVKCVHSNISWWTEGKVYEIKDGVIRDDEGDSRRNIKTFEDLLEVTIADKNELEFEPYVELYNGKVVCVDLQGCNKGNYTVGKIYQFKDGQLTTDDGDKIPTTPVRTFEDWEKFTSSKFIEVKE